MEKLMSKVLLGSTLFLLLFSVNAFSQYANQKTGDFDTSSSWVGNSIPTETWKTITIVANSTITKNGNFTWNGANVAVNGTFIVNGGLTAGYGGLTVNDTLIVSGAFNGNLTANSNSVVNAGSFSGGTFDVQKGALLTVGSEELSGSCTLTNHSYIRNGGTVVIYGDFNLQSNITIEAGGTLIIHGSFNALGNWGMNISGNIVVTGNFSATNGTIQNSGNVVIGGDFTFGGGGFGGTNSENFYIVDPDATITPSNWGTNKYGDLDDFVANESGNTTLYDLVVEELGLVTITYTWTGSVSNSWGTVGNWKEGKIPTSGTNVAINNVTRAPIVSEGTEAEAKAITMGTGAILTLDPGARMTVSGNISNTGATILLKNTVSKPTSFLTKGTISAPVTVQWIYPNGRYMYVGHSVDGVTYANYDTPTANSFNLYRYTGTAWSAITSSAGLGGTENTLEGYTVKFNETADVSVTYSGTLRTGNYSKAINGWNLIANPYPTYLDLKSSGLVLGNSLSSVWTTANASGKTVYATYNIASALGANGGTQYVAPGQSFWVRNYSSSSLTISNTARVHATGVLKSASVSTDILRITLTGGSDEDEMVLAFRSSGSDSYSEVYDSEKRFSTGTGEVSVYSQKSGKSLIINVLPDENLESQNISLWMNIGTQVAGTYVIKAVNITEFMPDMDVFLLDKSTGETTNLREKPEYTFDAVTGSSQDRFELSFKAIEKVPDVTTGINNGTTSDIVITAMGVGSKTIVKVKDVAFAGKVHIEVVDASGKLVQAVVSQTDRTEINAPSNTPFYMVKVVYNNVVKSFKIMNITTIH
ncbi:MAG: hypothetical protein QM786_14885 [Breznakibacter sp.]